MKIELNKKNIIIKIPVKKFKELFGDFSSEPKTIMTDEIIETVTPEVTPEEVVAQPEVAPEATPTEVTPEVPVETPVEPTQEVPQ